jgi:hypothetical protein
LERCTWETSYNFFSDKTYILKGNEMNDEGDRKGKVNDHKAPWLKLPRIGQIQAQLNKKGVFESPEQNPEFGDTQYSVILGLRINADDPILYGTLSTEAFTLTPGDQFYASVDRETGLFSVRLKARDLASKKVTIEYCAIPQSVGTTVPPTPTPFNFKSIIGLRGIGFNLDNYPNRKIDELENIISGDLWDKLDAHKHEIEDLATLASANIEQIAPMLGVSEVEAMGLIYQARAVLTGMNLGEGPGA